MTAIRQWPWVLWAVAGASATAVAQHPSTASVAAAGATTRAPEPAPSAASALARAFDLEGTARSHEAAAAFRRALALAGTARDRETRDAALLGLERTLIDGGEPDSLLTIVADALQQDATNGIAHAIVVRTLTTLHRDAPARAAYDRWRAVAPHDVAPYLEFARLLLDEGQRTAADSVLADAQRAPLSRDARRALVPSRARSLAAALAWTEAARAWREVLANDADYDNAVVFSLRPTPDSARDAVVAALTPAGVRDGDMAARRAAAHLLVLWHRPSAAAALAAALPRDTAARDLWRAVAAELDASGARREAADAWQRVLDVSRPGSGDAREALLRAAEDALSGGEPARTLALLDGRAVPGVAAGDAAALTLRLLRARALAALGRVDEAERLAADVPAPAGTALADALAEAWIARGDVARASALLRRAGADSGEAAGWLALARGDLRGARVRFAHAPPASTPALGLLGDVRTAARAVLARTRADSAPELGAALLAAARGDASSAAAALERAAGALPDVAAPLLAAAADVAARAGDRAHAVALWTRVLASGSDAPEAPGAELAWARALLAAGDRAGARTHFEHLVVTYPDSALVPIARRELDRLGTA